MATEITPRAIKDLHIRSPDGWVRLPTTGIDSLRDWARDAAGELTESDEARARAAVQLHDWTMEMARDEPMVLAAAWVDSLTGDVAAVMRIVLVVDDDRPMTLEGWRALVEPDRRRAVKVLGEREIVERDLPAGRALYIHEQVARGRLIFKQLEEHFIYMVFPPDCDEALDVTFSSPYLTAGPRLAEEAELIMSTLTVDVGDRVEPP
jgi:hypothetical protein